MVRLGGLISHRFIPLVDLYIKVFTHINSHNSSGPLFSSLAMNFIIAVALLAVGLSPSTGSGQTTDGKCIWDFYELYISGPLCRSSVGGNKLEEHSYIKVNIKMYIDLTQDKRVHSMHCLKLYIIKLKSSSPSPNKLMCSSKHSTIIIILVWNLEICVRWLTAWKLDKLGYCNCGNCYKTSIYCQWVWCNKSHSNLHRFLKKVIILRGLNLRLIYKFAKLSMHLLPMQWVCRSCSCFRVLSNPTLCHIFMHFYTSKYIILSPKTLIVPV